MNGTAVALVSASISAVVALAVVLLSAYLERRRQTKAARIARLAAFLAAFSENSIHMGRLARTPMAEKLSADAAEGGEHADRINRILAEIELVEDRAVLNSALALDSALDGVYDDALSKEWTRQEWRALRRARLRPAYDSFVKTAREALGSTAAQ